jgi:hypothetical protein
MLSAKCLVFNFVLNNIYSINITFIIYFKMQVVSVMKYFAWLYMPVCQFATFHTFVLFRYDFHYYYYYYYYYYYLGWSQAMSGVTEHSEYWSFDQISAGRFIRRV